MAASVLSTPEAVRISVFVVRAFVEMRSLLNAHKELRTKLDELELRYDRQFTAVFQSLRSLLNNPDARHRPIGFRQNGIERQ